MELLTIPEAADRLKLHRASLYDAIAAGKFTKHYSKGGRLRLDAAEVDQYRVNWHRDLRPKAPGKYKRRAR